MINNKHNTNIKQNINKINKILYKKLDKKNIKNINNKR